MLVETNRMMSTCKADLKRPNVTFDCLVGKFHSGLF